VRSIRCIQLDVDAFTATAFNVGAFNVGAFNPGSFILGSFILGTFKLNVGDFLIFSCSDWNVFDVGFFLLHLLYVPF